MKRPLPYYSSAIWPPVLLVVPLAMFYGLISGFLWLLARTHPDTAGLLANSDEIKAGRISTLALFAAAYALFRLKRFHPALNPAYAAWLKMSPWTGRRPLPLGPVHLVWQDAAVLAALTAIAHWHAQGNPIWPVAIFSLVYFGGLTLLLAYTRQWWHCLALGFLWPALALPGAWNSLPVCLIILAIILVTWHGHRRSLQAFPWKSFRDETSSAAIQQVGAFNFGSNNSPVTALNLEIRLDVINSTITGRNFHAGWPFMAISPKVNPSSVSNTTTLFTGLMAGWWNFCLVEPANPAPIPMLVFLFALLAGVMRMAIYCTALGPPFNLRGRLWHGRLIVPGYDKVFVTPLTVVLTGVDGALLANCSGPWHPLIESASITVIWWLLFGGGPTLRNWLLTGQHHFNPARLGRNRQAIRPV